MCKAFGTEPGVARGHLHESSLFAYKGPVRNFCGLNEGMEFSWTLFHYCFSMSAIVHRKKCIFFLRYFKECNHFIYSQTAHAHICTYYFKTYLNLIFEKLKYVHTLTFLGV